MHFLNESMPIVCSTYGCGDSSPLLKTIGRAVGALPMFFLGIFGIPFAPPPPAQVSCLETDCQHNYRRFCCILILRERSLYVHVLYLCVFVLSVYFFWCAQYTNIIGRPIDCGRGLPAADASTASASSPSPSSSSPTAIDEKRVDELMEQCIAELERLYAKYKVRLILSVCAAYRTEASFFAVIFQLVEIRKPFTIHFLTASL